MRMRALLTAACVCLAARPIFAQLAAKPAVIDFGYRGHNENPTEILILSNTGTVPITLKELKASCSCIKVEPAVLSKPIPAGGSVELKVSMGSGRAMGILEKHVDITAVEGGVRPVRVPVGMRVFNSFVMEPLDLRFDGVVGGQAVTQFVDVKWRPAVRPPRPFVLTDPVVVGVSGPTQKISDHLTAKVTDIPGGKRIEVTLKPSHPEGRIWGNLEARLDGKLLLVPVVGEMFRAIKIVPTYFNFSRVSADDPSSFVEESVFTSTDSRTFKILSMTPKFTRTTGPEVRLELEEKPAVTSAGREHVLRARISGGEKHPPGSFSGTVLVRTDHPEKLEVTLNFFGFFAEPKK